MKSECCFEQQRNPLFEMVVGSIDVCNSGQIMHVRKVVEGSIREDSSKSPISEHSLIEIRNVSA